MIENLGHYFTEPLMMWFDEHGRKCLPWQSPKDPYRIWVSEIMLQQTQVKTVIPYFTRFVERFPTVQALAAADEESLLAHWAGLGYYSRAHNLLKTAIIICQSYEGKFPQTLSTLLTLPGIGPSTAAAIASQAFNQPTAILDGNVKRVLCRFFKIAGNPAKRDVNLALWELANQCMQATSRYADYTQAIMDLGALCCTHKRPNCAHCPLKTACKAYSAQEVSLYPEKKIKKTLPIRQQQFLLFHTKEQKIYLEKRPSKGLWQGLWCPPIIDLEQALLPYIGETYGFKALQTNDLTFIKHTLSHFQFHIYGRAILCEDTDKTPTKGEWVTCAEALKRGLAKPIKQLIEELLTSTFNDLES